MALGDVRRWCPRRLRPRGRDPSRLVGHHRGRRPSRGRWSLGRWHPLPCYAAASRRMALRCGPGVASPVLASRACCLHRHGGLRCDPGHPGARDGPCPGRLRLRPGAPGQDGARRVDGPAVVRGMAAEASPPPVRGHDCRLCGRSGGNHGRIPHPAQPAGRGRGGQAGETLSLRPPQAWGRPHDGRPRRTGAGRPDPSSRAPGKERPLPLSAAARREPRRRRPHGHPHRRSGLGAGDYVRRHVPTSRGPASGWRDHIGVRWGTKGRYGHLQHPEASRSGGKPATCADDGPDARAEDLSSG